MISLVVLSLSLPLQEHSWFYFGQLDMALDQATPLPPLSRYHILSAYCHMFLVKLLSLAYTADLFLFWMLPRIITWDNFTKEGYYTWYRREETSYEATCPSEMLLLPIALLRRLPTAASPAPRSSAVFRGPPSLLLLTEQHTRKRSTSVTIICGAWKTSYRWCVSHFQFVIWMWRCSYNVNVCNCILESGVLCELQGKITLIELTTGAHDLVRE
jgi:hypothetical protein